MKTTDSFPSIMNQKARLTNFVAGCRHRAGSSFIRPECQILLNLNHRRRGARMKRLNRVWTASFNLGASCKVHSQKIPIITTRGMAIHNASIVTSARFDIVVVNVSPAIRTMTQAK